MLYSKDIKLLVVHCSDTPDKDDIGALEIHKMHIGFGWDGIGYHKIIRRDGEIENGRPEFWIGAHVYGKNDQSLGVCLIGQKSFNKKQFSSLAIILKDWKTKYPNSFIKGHHEVIKTKKTCPNFDVQKWCAQRNLT
ncbi:N-acetylmuramoyl-L-alanine amidase [Alphaproteobacteria bacterium]|nr:N-acetylmuramoyl-L-alanine amidase [Alphaproteobacteria bacterium]